MDVDLLLSSKCRVLNKEAPAIINETTNQNRYLDEPKPFPFIQNCILKGTAEEHFYLTHHTLKPSHVTFQYNLLFTSLSVISMYKCRF